MTTSPNWFPGDFIYPANEPQREAVRHAQRVLRLAETGDLDDTTRAALRGFQGLFKLRVSGIMDSATAIKLEEIRNQYA